MLEKLELGAQISKFEMKQGLLTKKIRSLKLKIEKTEAQIKKLKRQERHVSELPISLMKCANKMQSTDASQNIKKAYEKRMKTVINGKSKRAISKTYDEVKASLDKELKKLIAELEEAEKALGTCNQKLSAAQDAYAKME